MKYILITLSLFFIQLEVHSENFEVKMLNQGAEGVMIGRSFVYGLSAGGKEGVTKSLEILNKELDMTMALCGRRDINDVGRDIIKDCPFFEKN